MYWGAEDLVDSSYKQCWSYLKDGITYPIRDCSEVIIGGGCVCVWMIWGFMPQSNLDTLLLGGRGAYRDCTI